MDRPIIILGASPNLGHGLSNPWGKAALGACLVTYVAAHRQAYRQAHGQADRQADRETERQRDSTRRAVNIAMNAQLARSASPFD